MIFAQPKNDLEVDPAVVDKKSEGYWSKPKTKNKRNKRKWVNNKKIRWKDQPKVSSFPTHLLPKNDPPIKGVPAAVAKRLQSFLDRAQVQGMEQIDDYVYYDSNSESDNDDEDNDHTFQDAIQVEDVIDGTDNDKATIYRETINNDFIAPVGIEDRVTRVTIEHEGILHAQYSHYGELYYQSCEIYGDNPAETKKVIDIMAYSGELWSLCDNAPPLQANPMLSLRSEMEYDQLRSEMKYDQQMIEMNQRLAYQGLLNNCKDVGITETELQEAQAPLKPSIRRPAMEDWERMRKYFGNVPANIV